MRKGGQEMIEQVPKYLLLEHAISLFIDLKTHYYFNIKMHIFTYYIVQYVNKEF